MNSEYEDRLEKLISRLSEVTAGDAKAMTLLNEIEREVARRQKLEAEQAQMIAEYAQAYEKLTSPANRVGLWLRRESDTTALIGFGETDYLAQIDPKLEIPSDIQRGARVLLNEAYAVVGVFPQSSGGAIVKVSEVLAEGRLRIGDGTPGSASRVVERSEALEKVDIQPGDEVRIEPTGRVALEHFAHNQTRDYFIEETPQTPWEAIGGQDEAIKLVRETIEQPLLHPEIYERFDKKPVKGILLYGPPGCGKTLLGKAIAYNLAKEYSKRVGHEVKECFMSISGPKILNMWLGESERMVREIFATARKVAKEGRLVVIFIDEAESILRTRSAGRFLNISNTVVPQFCAEMDGILGLENAVVILTSNRPDYIDPAILRPERIDRKVKIRRPNREASKDILSIYLHETLPMDPELVKEMDGEASCARKELIEYTLNQLWKAEPETEFLRVFLRNGSTDTLYFRDLVSGALLKSLVDRAKDYAIARALLHPGTEVGLQREDMRQAIFAEFQENEIFPKSDVMEDWLKLIDVEAENVVNVRPIGRSKGESAFSKSVI